MRTDGTDGTDGTKGSEDREYWRASLRLTLRGLGIADPVGLVRRAAEKGWVVFGAEKEEGKKEKGEPGRRGNGEAEMREKRRYGVRGRRGRRRMRKENQ